MYRSLKSIIINNVVNDSGWRINRLLLPMHQINHITTYLHRNYIFTVWFFIIFYSVGVAGTLIPAIFTLFTKLIPAALLLSIATLAIYHTRFSYNQIILFFIIYLIAYGIESIGVNSAFFFGSYQYGESLGIKLFNTPLIIGLNWLLLVYLTASVSDTLKVSTPIKIITGAFLMLGYDVILEQMAPVLDMWYWHAEEVPVQNYITWFVLSLFFHMLVRIFKVPFFNKLAPVILACQLGYFIALYFTLKA